MMMVVWMEWHSSTQFAVIGTGSWEWSVTCGCWWLTMVRPTIRKGYPLAFFYLQVKTHRRLRQHMKYIYITIHLKNIGTLQKVQSQCRFWKPHHKKRKLWWIVHCHVPHNNFGNFLAPNSIVVRPWATICWSQKSGVKLGDWIALLGATET